MLGDLLHRARLQAVAAVLLLAAFGLLVAALVIALVPTLGLAGAVALVGILLALAGFGLLAAARQPSPPPPPKAASDPPPENPWIPVVAHAAAVLMVTLTNRRR